ncbi:MAG: hypothetical protein WBW16_09355 [Bacteroidota bacterium]
MSSIIQLDPLDKFLSHAESKLSETKRAFPQEFSRLNAIDSTYLRIQQNLDNTHDWIPGLLFLRTHASWRAAVRLELSGQLPESYTVLRATVESALYGIYLARNRTSIPTWLHRNDNEQSKQKVREEFTVGALMQTLRADDQPTHAVADRLYQQAIDMGAHPNQLAVTSNLRMDTVDTKTLLRLAYLSGDPLAIAACQKANAQVGVCCLRIFRNVYKQRFDLLGITQDLSTLERGL